MRIRWTTRASDDLDLIFTHIAQDNARVALDVGRRLYEGIMGLAEFPERGRMGLRQDTRELVFASLPYIAVYRIRGEIIQILRIWHGAQKRT